VGLGKTHLMQAVGHTIKAETIAQALDTMPRNEWIRAFGNRATTAEVKDHMLSKGWPLGEPSDNETDEFLHRPENLPRILPGYVPPPAQR